MPTTDLHSLELAAGTLRYRESGSGTPLLILHGWGVDSSVMTSIMNRLSGIRRCIAIDFPGFGGSDLPPNPWGVDDYAEVVRQLIHALDLGKCDILAHSFGGRVTLSLLASDTDQSQFGKVLITGGAGLKPRRSWRYHYRKNMARLLKAPFRLLPSSLRDKGLGYLRTTTVWKSLGSSDYQKLQGVMREVFVKTVNHYQDGLLPSIKHEVLLIWGVNDDATPIDQGYRLEKGLPKATLIKIEQAGHYAFLDQPAAFGAIAEAYFKG
jgi:pimeloyl-ACP methyl ester carboxylesterase